MASGTVASVTTVTPAQAVTGLRYISGYIDSGSGPRKTLTIICHSGDVAIGGGAHLTGALGDVTIRQIQPTVVDGTGRLIVVAEEDPDGYSGSWRLDATAVCVPRPAGLSFVHGSMTDPFLVWATASCGSKRIIGSGYILSDTGVVKAAGAQIGSSNRAYVSAEPSRVPGAVTPVTGTAVAVCANVALPGMREVEAETAQNSFDGKSATATCPAGTTVIGVGGGLFGRRNHTVIDDFRIKESSASVTVTGYEDQAGNPDGWAVSATAVCAT
ncbi:MAG TPA: hypothetical protein DGT23_30830 [Micromonosporaceae bacterium]|nr:hypothetical protein [Micromonosporaceae bacterium]